MQRGSQSGLKVIGRPGSCWVEGQAGARGWGRKWPGVHGVLWVACQCPGSEGLSWEAPASPRPGVFWPS